MLYELRKQGKVLKSIPTPMDKAGRALPKKDAVEVVLTEARKIGADWIFTSDHNDIQVQYTPTPKAPDKATKKGATTL